MGGEGQVVEADAADQETHSEREADEGREQESDAATENRAKQAEKRAERAEERARQAEKRAEEAKTKAAQAQSREPGSVDADAVAEELAQRPELQRMSLDIGWESVTDAEREAFCASWAMDGDVRELILDATIEAARGVIERDVASAYYDEKCS
ncbi:hypothetical protein [Ornithinicoccus halotolerans]|uniref:hypothetical protein n=1 Tax=Ornithinicoccus halotolerans TaxID=1748220 RepID=UPI00129560FC|nr:hypothetical protein [Ornithinicoccus halotolerans]